jgi:SAM-dependent methyltransferase
MRPGEDDGAVIARIGALSAVAGEFGLATPCGWGRLAMKDVPALLEAHARLSRPVGHPNGYEASFSWPEGVARIPDDDWTQAALDTFGVRYDAVDTHGWYHNLDPTVEQLATHLSPGDLLIDFSGGTGILLNRLFLRIFDRPIGALIVDASQKFLRVAVEHFHEDTRVGVRLLRYLKEERRLQLLDEVLEPPLLDRKADAIVSTNAIHLYTNLDETLEAWARVLQPGGRVFINSGNVRNPDAATNEWILDETVYVVHEVATGIVRTNPRFEKYCDVLLDEDRVGRYLEYRDRVFVPPRPLDLYVHALGCAGFDVVEVTKETITATIDDWFDLLTAYHESVLGWVGGTEKIDGSPPSEEAVADRLALIKESLDAIFGARPEFRCCWTYIQAVCRGDA